MRSGAGRLRLLVAAFGDPGHAYPAIALALALRRRGHRVVVESWERWREAVEGAGLEFTAAEEYRTFPPPRPDSPEGADAAEAARALAPLLEDLRPHVVVSDILTLAPSLAAEVAGVARVTLIPHIYPVHEPGLPFFAIGAHPPRTAGGRVLWARTLPVLETGLRRGRRELNQQRDRLGLGPLQRFHGGISQELAMVATFPQLEYPRSWPPRVSVTGPMVFELPFPEIGLPPGEAPLVLVAPSTSQDPENRLVRAALESLSGEPVRVVATVNREASGEPPEVPANALLVDWLSYSQVMPLASLVICHGGHGTVARALGEGVPVLTSPVAGDMNETAARIAWAGVGLSVPWRFCRPGPLRWAARELLRDTRYAMRAEAVAEWGRRHDGAARGAELVEGLAAWRRLKARGPSDSAS
jgi:UDP:flavonoid glycosyltransferase YjiC (YdhE family)